MLLIHHCHSLQSEPESHLMRSPFQAVTIQPLLCRWTWPVHPAASKPQVGCGYTCPLLIAEPMYQVTPQDPSERSPAVSTAGVAVINGG